MQIKKTKTGEACYWLALLIELIIVIVDKSAYINPWEGQLFRVTFLLFCIKIAMTQYSKKEWLCILFFGCIAMLSYLINDRDEAVRVVALIAASKGISLKKNMKVILWVTFAGCMTLILLSVTGIFGSTAMVADFGRGAVEKRYTLGLGHPNALHCMFWMVLTLILYVYQNAIKWYHYALMALSNLLLFYLTDSNTGMLLVFAMLAAVVSYKYISFFQNQKWVYLLAGAVVIGCVIFSMYGSMVGNGFDQMGTVMYKIDGWLNGRYKYCHVVEAARMQNWTWFASAENIEIFDAGFVRLFYWYGIIPGAIYVAMNLYLVYQSWKTKDFFVAIMVVTFSIYMLMEAHFISVYLLRNYLFILMGYYWNQPLLQKNDTEGYFWQVRKLLGREG